MTSSQRTSAEKATKNGHETKRTNGHPDALTSREMLAALRALKRGEFDRRMRDDLTGADGQICEVFNAIADQMQAMEAEFADLRLGVGREGRTRRRMKRGGVQGGWGRMLGSVNDVLDDVTLHTEEMARVVIAVAKGDLNQRIDLHGTDEPLLGDFLRHARAVNGMVEQLGVFGAEVTRVAQEVGVEGQLGAQAKVPGVSGTWKELTDSVNLLASNLTNQVRNIAEVTTAIAEGDLSRKITVDARGEILALKETINKTVDKLNRFSGEVTRVARLVGTAGTLGVQAEVKDVSGIWRELTDNVNSMADNLTNQVRNIAEITTAVANGDLSKKITVEVKGELLDLKNTVNEMVDALRLFANEVSRMAREVGTEGVLGGQAKAATASGVWRELTDNVNSMASNLTNQVRNISEVSSAVAGGDLSKKITVDARGEVLELKETINDMVDQLNRFAAEVTRVAREVGVDGKLGGQAFVEGVRGVWKELTDNVNGMASNLTNQVRDIADVTTAVAKGDLTREITVDARGEILELKNTVNTMVDQLRSFADEVTRLAREVGVEGKLGAQADVRGVSGTWRALTDAVNSMAANLTGQVRSISDVASAIAQGDLQKKITVEAKGEILALKNTINTMVDQLSSFAEEVTRVSREVGTEGKLGGQAAVIGVRGTWKELTDSVNLMASNLTNQVRDIIQVATAIAAGDLSKKVTVEVRGELFELKGTINAMVDQLGSLADEVTRVARDVGVEGVLGGQAEVRGASGLWRELTENVNMMASNLTHQVRDIAQVTTAVANGDLSKKISVEVRGEILELKVTINTMVDQLSAFADEVTRVAREVGTEGILGGQAEVRGVSGTWRELTDNVNEMAKNLTSQVRGIARVVTAVANGDLGQELRLDARGEIATLVETINSMLVTLSTFTDQVSGVARDVGVEGKLGGQADVPGAAGVWRDLTNNVNELAGNLTRQVRAIADVATAVTKGDLTRAIDVEAKGEVALLKDNVNQMIGALAETTRQNSEQDWLKTNLGRFTRMLQGQRDLLTVADQILSELAPVMDAQHGAFYVVKKDNGDQFLELFASYAYTKRKELSARYAFGESLVGQAAREKKRILVGELSSDYVLISSALGKQTPLNLVVVPVLFEGEVKAVIELASVHQFSDIRLAFVDQLVESLGIVIATIAATMRTDELLQESQGMAEELQTQQEELQQTNEELEEKAEQLTAQRDEVERKNRLVEIGRQEIEEKAEQLALTSKYKSQFLANMSHELRTPLNSLLILSQKLAENRLQHLDEQEVEYAATIRQAGSDLLALINEVLDLAKIESGTMPIDVGEVELAELERYVERSFRPVAAEKDLELTIEMGPDLPSSILTDDMRLRQILRNLLSNAFKFTHEGGVTVRFELVEDRSRIAGNPALSSADQVVAMTVTDTGIGISKDKQRVIFEAFQQAEGGTSRKYGGTGLGLAISREIALLLGGELTVESEPDQGSAFTFYVPAEFRARAASKPAPLPDRSPPKRSLPQPVNRPAFEDDRSAIATGDRVLLIVEDNETFARTLMEMARRRGFRALVALTGEEALELAVSLKPDAITLDLRLPDMDGWVVLDRLKHQRETRHIPVQIISAIAEERRGLDVGAVAVIQKPIDHEGINAALSEIQAFLEKRVRRLLVVEDDQLQRKTIIDLIGNGDVSAVAVADGESALAALQREPFDCMVLDLKLPGMSGLDLIRSIKDDAALRRTPIVVYTGKELSDEERTELRKLADTVIIKDAWSPERLLEETALFLHRVEAKLPEPKQKMLRSLVHGDPALQNKTVLIADDDPRNVFAAVALVEDHEMNVITAENGREALDKLEQNEAIDIVLMDVMMPEMDGYEAIRRIRAVPRWKDLPIIALTAKAMKGDREKCIEAGASDYITKPVDADQLISLLRVWLYQK